MSFVGNYKRDYKLDFTFISFLTISLVFCGRKKPHSRALAEEKIHLWGWFKCLLMLCKNKPDSCISVFQGLPLQSSKVAHTNK